MRILVPIKRVPDSDTPARIRSDGLALDDSAQPGIPNPFDAIALEAAIQLRESGHANHISAASIGPPACDDVLRTALAMGADDAIRVATDEPLDPWNVAAILASLARRLDPGLVIMGKQATDDDANQAGQFLAALLDWPQATFASRIELLAGDPPKARVERETDHGRETLCLDLPAVITVDLRLNEPRYASLPSLIKARKKPIETLDPETLGVKIEPRVRILGLELAAVARTCRRVTDVDELLRCLKDEARVL